jgi:hypothetical protein
MQLGLDLNENKTAFIHTFINFHEYKMEVSVKLLPLEAEIDTLEMVVSSYLALHEKYREQE